VGAHKESKRKTTAGSYGGQVSALWGTLQLVATAWAAVAIGTHPQLPKIAESLNMIMVFPERIEFPTASLRARSLRYEQVITILKPRRAPE